MLTLQRASAGSGKTYTLTKEYIRLLISIPSGKNGEGPRRLRTDEELRDSAEHILAVTFTNKATNEMKERVLQKLNELAFPPASEKEGELPKVDYLKDFIQEFNTTPREISEACKTALSLVLYNYSDFNISTIDAFFQNILRVFAYESDLPDGYSVIVGSDGLASMAAEDLVNDVAAGRLPRSKKEWITDMVMTGVREGKNYWEVFQRNSGKSGLYKDIVGMAYLLGKEEFKEIREDLDEYSKENPDVRKVYNDIRNQMLDLCVPGFAGMVEAAKILYHSYESILDHPEVRRQYGADGFPTVLKVAGQKYTPLFKKVLKTNADPLEEVSFSPAAKLTGVSLFVKNSSFKGEVKKTFEDLGGSMLDEVRNLDAAHKEWLAVVDTPEVKFWNFIKSGFGRLALMLDMRERISQYLTDIDAMQLDDTNAVLHRIINGDDVPFIYERVGSRLNHFLIDEFQDTSLRQWENFFPLLSESVGRGNDNLIIGDAKQSIYRFRGAEPGLITHIVPESFDAAQLKSKGFSKDENANHRSDRNVVEFNNYVFAAIAPHLDDYLKCADNMPRIANLYANTVQYPCKREHDGYVQVKYIPGDSENGDSTDDNFESSDKATMTLSILKEIKATIKELLERGYRQSEIAVLVNTKANGAQIIEYLMNAQSEENSDINGLKFVSEDSLMLKRSKAIAILIECFGIIEGRYAKEFAEKEDVKTGKPEKRNEDSSDPGDYEIRHVQWKKIAHAFTHYLTTNPRGDLHESLREFFESEQEDDTIDKMIYGMQAVTLPSLTEALVEIFVPQDLRRSEAPFIAAFQDAILDYCESRPTDVASMLRWWRAEGMNISISSPEGTDAINVMTIHKSKGLEFPCVILPDLYFSFSLRNSEFLWAPVDPKLSYAGKLPGYMPVNVTKKMVNDLGDDNIVKIYDDMAFAECVDKFNKGYVAFTRARNELYIICPAKKGDNRPRMSKQLKSVLVDLEDELPALIEKYGDDFMPAADNFNIEIGEEVLGESLITYGVPVKDVAAHLKKYREDKAGTKEQRDLDDYFVNSDIEYLKYHEEGPAPRFDTADDDREDPRSEGSILHAVLENVIEEDDIDKALTIQRIRGKITRDEQRSLAPFFREALASVRDLGWFGGCYKVFTERPMLTANPIMKRPDRVMISPDGEGVVVDYKFGSSAREKDHVRQITEYADLLKATGLVKSVSAWLWYVKEGKIEKII